MKNIIMLAIAMICTFSVAAQSNSKFEQKGTTFIQMSKETVKESSAILTKYTWQDSKGNSYPIYLSKNGKAFVKRISQKSGNEYNYYLDKEISEKISKEYLNNK